MLDICVRHVLDMVLNILDMCWTCVRHIRHVQVNTVSNFQISFIIRRFIRDNVSLLNVLFLFIREHSSLLSTVKCDLTHG